MTPDHMIDRIAICELKTRYCRFLDTKQWDAWAELFTENMVLDTSEAGGPPPVPGCDAAIALARSTIEAARTAYLVQTLEIRIDGGRAEGIWAMQDRTVFKNGDNRKGYGHYTETYGDGGVWRIATSRLTRLLLDFVASPE